jgi:hypothetical protein
MRLSQGHGRKFKFYSHCDDKPLEKFKWKVSPCDFTSLRISDFCVSNGLLGDQEK